MSELRRSDWSYQGTIQVKHFIRILYEEIGLEKIKSKVTQPLTGFPFAPHYGCHYIKPAETDRRDRSGGESPILDRN